MQDGEWENERNRKLRRKDKTHTYTNRCFFATAVAQVTAAKPNSHTAIMVEVTATPSV